MTVACGVDADADAVQGCSGGHARSPEGKHVERPRRHVVEVGVSLPRKILGQAILVISGQSRMMYQCLTPKPEGTISAKRSMPQAGDTSPHDTSCQHDKLAGIDHTRLGASPV